MVVSNEEGLKIFQAELAAGKYTSNAGHIPLLDNSPATLNPIRGVDSELVIISILCIGFGLCGYLFTH